MPSRNRYHTARAAFCRAVRALLSARPDLSLEALGRALVGHRDLVPDAHGRYDSARKVAERLLDPEKLDVRVTLDDAAAWDGVLPGVLAAYLATYELDYDLVPRARSEGGALGPMRATGALVECVGGLMRELNAMLADEAITSSEAESFAALCQRVVEHARGAQAAARAAIVAPPTARRVG